MTNLPLDFKAHARDRLQGIWAAVPTPFMPSFAIDEAGLRKNLHHWFVDLAIAGLFVCGKQGEFFSMSVAERKRVCDIAVAAAREYRPSGGIMMSCSDQNLDTVIELAKHAEHAGADYIVVHAPMLHFGQNIDNTVREYYRHIASQVNIGVVMWSHPDSGYVLSPETCARIAAECRNVVAIKYSVPRKMYAELTEMTRDSLIVSTSSETEWLDNIMELGWRLYLCSIPPILYQTKTDRRMQQYTGLAFQGRFEEARRIRDSLDAVRHAMAASRAPGTPHAQQKYWQELLGQVGGPVRRPLLPLSESERAAIRRAFEQSGLSIHPDAQSASA
ncbi:MAG TPA: dihydrodipicolinate synthase family protein [Steroidobacteraceae bacterium]|nr:dihydrodipicolinate synthase family protein [Steroidobacteraceae bacterium]